MAKAGKRPPQTKTAVPIEGDIEKTEGALAVTGAGAGAPPTGFDVACLAVADELRGAILALYASVLADPTNPQDVARRFGVNKTLTWTITRVLAAEDPVALVATAPGAGSMKSLISAMEKAGAPAAVVARAWSAVRAADETVAFHVGDRATLQLIVDGMTPTRDDHLEASRRLAFRGNSGLWGVQARLRTATSIIAPNAKDPSVLDMAVVRGLIGLRRLRSNLSWPVFHMRNWGTGRSNPQPLEEPLPGQAPSPLLRRFSALAASDVIETRTPNGAIYTLAPGPIGNTGAVDCYTADYEIGTIPRYATAEDPTGEVGANVSVPIERIMIDVIAHHSLSFILEATPIAYTALFGATGSQSGPYGRIPLPAPLPPARLPGPPVVAAIPSVPVYADIIAFAFERMGWDPREFVGRRCEYSYPPLGSTLSLAFDLPERR